MKQFNSIEELQPYLNEKGNTYEFIENGEAFDIEINFDLTTYKHIFARDINACGIKVYSIDARDINAVDIDAWKIDACDINAGNITAGDIDACDIDSYDINAGNINAYNINADNIDAFDIDARNIKACDINANIIKANTILFDVVCFAHDNIICEYIKGAHKNSKYFSLYGEVIIKEDSKMKKYEAKIAEIDDYGMLEGLGFNQVDDAIKIYTFHRHYLIGNKHSYQNLQECIKDNEKDNHIISLYMYDHSGLAFSLVDFNDRWDSGLLGCICIRKNISRLEANKIAYDMVKEANHIENGAFVELVINELDICDCCNNIKSKDFIDGFIFNVCYREEKEAVVKFVNSYIKDFDINALDKLIENRYK